MSKVITEINNLTVKREMSNQLLCSGFVKVWAKNSSKNHKCQNMNGAGCPYKTFLSQGLLVLNHFQDLVFKLSVLHLQIEKRRNTWLIGEVNWQGSSKFLKMFCLMLLDAKVLGV